MNSYEFLRIHNMFMSSSSEFFICSWEFPILRFSQYLNEFFSYTYQPFRIQTCQPSQIQTCQPSRISRETPVF